VRRGEAKTKEDAKGGKGHFALATDFHRGNTNEDGKERIRKTGTQERNA